MFDLNSLIRANIRDLKPYTAARDEYKGTEGTFLDANENAFGSATTQLHNRYPDPLQWSVKKELARIKKVTAESIFIGNGSDEAIDLLFRSFCNPQQDNVLITPPTYGMYEVSASINDVALKRVNLDENFHLSAAEVIKAIDAHTKIIILCSPNNPTGNCMDRLEIEKILSAFNGIVAIDEAYADFAADKSMLPYLNQYPNMVVMQTFSKAWGMANLRLGMAFASSEIIKILNKVKPPYNISGLSQDLALEALKNENKKNEYVAQILIEKIKLEAALKNIAFIKKVYPSDANFILVKTIAGNKIYDELIKHKVVVRNRSNVHLIADSLRITVGTSDENRLLIEALKEIEQLF